MRTFSRDECNQGSPEWWELRRGIPTSSSFDRILTAKKMQYSSQAEDYMAELAGDVANLEPNWFTERYNKPPNHAVEEGVRREDESRKWLEFERDCTVLQVGFCLAASGLYGASPDGLILTDSGCLAGTLELKNPMLHTHARYLMSGELPSAYLAQCHGHLIVTGLERCTFLSYCPGLPPLTIDVKADEYTVALKAALERFTLEYLQVLQRLGLLARFHDLRASCLAHYPEEAP